MSLIPRSSRPHRHGAIATALALLAVVASLALGAAPVSANATITFSGPELLGQPTDTSMTINVVPNTSIAYYYEYGTSSGNYAWRTAEKDAASRTPSEMTISGLTPNTRYYYRMKCRATGQSEWITRDEHSFWTQRAAGSSFTFTITSDGHGETSAEHAQSWINVNADHPDFDIDLGDAFIVRNATSQSAVNSLYLAQRSATYFGAVSHSAPLFLAAGNHEDEEGWNLDDTPFSKGVASIQARKWYYPTPVDGGFYSGNTDTLAKIDAATYGDRLREDYYAWQWGDVLFVVIDPFQYTMNLPFKPGLAGEGTDDAKTGDQWSWTLGAQQYQWLKQTLEDSAAKYKFVFSHQILGGIPRDLNDGGEPGYVRGGAEAAGYFEWGGKNADDTEGFASHRNPANFPMPIHQLFLANGVSAYFHGHDHEFAYEMRDGIVYQEVPSPSITSNGFTSPYAEGDRGSYNTIKVLPSTGHLRVQLTPDQATVTYVRSNSGSSYTYTILPRPTTYTLTTAVDPAAGGTITPAAGTHPYDRDTVVAVTAAPAAGYRFDHWSGDCAGTGACEVTMNADKSVSAAFVDAQPPETTIASGPAELTNQDAATFVLGSDEEGVTYACALDGAAFAPCASPVDVTGLPDGAHQFSAAATDAAGNTDPSPAAYAWTIDTSPFTLDALTLRQSPDQAAWTPVHGDLAAGYTVSLDPVAEWRYLDVAALTASHPLQDGAYPFTLDQTALPADWLAYWAAKGVTAAALEPWQQQMWAIIHGDAPIFFLRVDSSGYMLVDGLLRALGQPDTCLRVNGDYPPAPYSYTGSLTDRYGATLPVTAALTFIGPAVPAPPVVSVAASDGAVHLSWPAVATDTTGRFTVVTAYQVFRSPTPFFAPGPDTLRAAPTAPEYADAAAGGGLFFYLVRAANIVGPSADSNHTAVFTFTLTPGATGGQMRAG